MITGVIVLFFVYTSLIALGQIATSRRNDEFTAGVFAVLAFAAIVLFAVRVRQMDLTKPTMVIGPRHLQPKGGETHLRCVRTWPVALVIAVLCVPKIQPTSRLQVFSTRKHGPRRMS